MIDPQAELAAMIAGLRREIEELQRAVGRPDAVVGASSNGLILQGGRLSGTTNASGEITLTFPTAFSATPVSVVAVRGGTSADATVTRATVSSTTAVFVCRNAGAVVNAGSVVIEWMALGAA